MTSDVKVDIFMPIYVGDLLADTLQLSTEQFGAYMLLLLHQWRKGHYTEDEALQISRLVGSSHLSASSSGKQEISRLLEPVLKLLMRDSSGLLFSRRNDEEKEKWTDRKRVFIERARKGGIGKARKMREEKANKQPASSTLEGMLEPCTSSSPSEEQKQPHPPRSTSRSGQDAAPAPRTAGPTPRSQGINLRRRGLSPRQLGTNPRNLGTNPRAKRIQGENSGKGQGEPAQASSDAHQAPGATASATGKKPTVAPHPMNGSHPVRAPQPADGRFEPFKREIFAYWRGLNPEHPNCPWGDPELRALEAFLSRHPDASLSSFKQLLHNRADSHVPGGVSPGKWIRGLMEYSEGPLNRFKKHERSRTL
jgi:uncharacterized protein YdaU (DUF1376 family)